MTRKVKLRVSKKIPDSDFYETLHKNYILDVCKKGLRVSDKDLKSILGALEQEINQRGLMLDEKQWSTDTKSLTIRIWRITAGII